jgi:hypothetical protein
MSDKIKNIDEAWVLVGAVRNDLRTAADEDEMWECRTSCAAAARFEVARLEKFVAALLNGRHGRAEYASRKELILPECVAELTQRARAAPGWIGLDGRLR